MNPTDFFKTASLLRNKKHQEHLRTSIGRSYYATLLYFRERLKSKGLEKTIQPTQSIHAFVIDCLQYSEISEGQKAAIYLRDLQQVRENADYQLDMVFKRNDADDALKKAKTALVDYGKITNERENQLVAKATVYAQKKSWI
ncbi:MAG: hypothetical protein JW749_00610 [Sedimentisphaerales bacterium]|nr:hypothetical protein [Sedimentisphaerales bacterium]